MKRGFDCLNDCPDLGYCCREFKLCFGGRTFGGLEKNLKPEFMTKRIQERGYPFHATDYDHLTGAWNFSCSKLGPDGRCTIYVDRPDVCRNFLPCSDSRLCCVHLNIFDRIVNYLQEIKSVFNAPRH